MWSAALILYLVHLVSAYDETSASATRSGDEGAYRAPNSIDGNFSTRSWSEPGFNGSSAWLKISLGKLYCVKNVQLYDEYAGYPDYHWFCYNSTYCYCWKGGSTNCSTLTIYTENSVNVVSDSNACKIGDTIKIERTDGFSVREIEISALHVREKEPGEIVPERAANSASFYYDHRGSSQAYEADNSIDGLFDTYSISHTGVPYDGSSAWLRIGLDKEGKRYCVERVVVYDHEGSTEYTWNCTNTGCNNCVEGSGTNCSLYTLEVFSFAEKYHGYIDNSISESRYPDLTDCKMGDMVEIERADDGFNVYEIAIIGHPVDFWSECSVTCGEGIQTRTRACTNPAPAHGGADCVGETSETRTCEGSFCPVDGGWSEFGDWSECSAECGGGTQSRSRACNNPAPDNGGAECGGDETQSQDCNTQHCPNQCPDSFPYAYNNGKHCCKSNREKRKKGKCDGGKIGMDSKLKCCKGKQKCRSGKCQDYQPPQTGGN